MLAIAANKQDLRKDQAVSDAQLAEYAALIGALHFGTSAKTGEGLTDIFEAIANSVAEQHRVKALLSGKLRHNKQLCIEHMTFWPPNKKGKSCCSPAAEVGS